MNTLVFFIFNDRKIECAESIMLTFRKLHMCFRMSTNTPDSAIITLMFYPLSLHYVFNFYSQVKISIIFILKLEFVEVLCRFKVVFLTHANLEFKVIKFQNVIKKHFKSSRSLGSQFF